MRKDQWLFVVLGACLVLLVVALFFLEGAKDADRQGGVGLVENGAGSDVDSDDVGASSGGGSSLGGGDGIVDENGEVVNVSATECGFYFEKYGVCAGVCPAGECVSEGRSCYCKS
jgi:hypothetical protein